ncbi:hypothetical protein UY3_03421 [Chelonia mydas]|uniref:Uncharacterized protein n=1 Tax=Chelonia mydas TaxID=8469 RepID=M7BQ94_CHEMY|nr:hypothetical protein UY3_03421 [Chelonia mydas]
MSPLPRTAAQESDTWRCCRSRRPGRTNTPWTLGCLLVGALSASLRIPAIALWARSDYRGPRTHGLCHGTPGIHGGSCSHPKGINRCREAPTSLHPRSAARLRQATMPGAPQMQQMGEEGPAKPATEVVTLAGPALSFSSPDEAIMGPPPVVSQDDDKAHPELLRRVASNLGLETEELEEPLDTLFNILSSAAPARVTLPMHEGVAKFIKALWQTPSSLTPISKCAEHKYYVPARGYEYFYTHPIPNSLVVSAVNDQESLQLRVANHQALLGRYDFNIWQLMAKFVDSLPEDLRKEFQAILEEGQGVTRAALLVASDATDSVARTKASATTTRRAVWLQSSGLSVEVQQSIQDFLFNGQTLFAEKTDDKLHGLKDLCTTLKTLGLCTAKEAV